MTKGIDAQSNIAPQRDHTTNTAAGSYIYIETTGKTPASKSLLIGPVFSSDISFYCRMRFYYYMNGKSVSKLSVYRRYEIGGGFTTFWTKSGSVGNYWERADFQMYASTTYSKNFQLIIESTAADVTKDEGIIAIDDISFSPECTISSLPMEVIVTTTKAPVCGTTGYKCSNNKCINMTQLCDFVQDCPSGEDELNCGICSFEKDNCGWVDNSFGEHFWNRTKAGDANIPKDNTLGTSAGSLVSYETTNGAFSGLSRLYSPVIGQTSANCEFQFYYYKNDAIKSVLFSLFLIDANKNVERIWKTDSSSNDWTRISVGLHSRSPGFKLYFEASQVLEPQDSLRLAIDDTNFINCGTSQNVSCTSKDVFKCGTGFCISNSLVCDFGNDCSDKSDEKNCTNFTRCDFEDDSNYLCSWNNDHDADFNWKRGTGQQFISSSTNYPSFGN
jgi:hypothetical protein